MLEFFGTINIFPLLFLGGFVKLFDGDLSLEDNTDVATDDAELAENLNSDNSDLIEAEGQLNQATEALERFGEVYAYLTSGKNISVEYAKEQIESTYRMVGLKSEAKNIAAESYSSMSKEVAIESLIDTVKNGISRVLNAFVRLQDFLNNKLSLAFRNVKSFVTFTESDINKTENKIQLLDKKSRDFVPSKKIRSYLKTRNGHPLEFKDVKEILDNHIDVLTKLTNNSEILKSLRGDDLDTYRILVTKAVRNSRNLDEEEINSEKEYIIDTLEKIYKDFRGFYKKPLADGKTLLFEFDNEGAERFAHFQDIFTVSVVNNHSYISPMDGKTLTRSEADQLMGKIRQLKDLYTSVEDFALYTNDLRRKIDKIDFASLLASVLSVIAGPIVHLVQVGLFIASFLTSVVAIVRTIGYTTSSLSYYAVRESCRYIRESI